MASTQEQLQEAMKDGIALIDAISIVIPNLREMDVATFESYLRSCLEHPWHLQILTQATHTPPKVIKRVS